MKMVEQKSFQLVAKIFLKPINLSLQQSAKISKCMAINVSTIKLNASIDQVWEALTSPEKVKLWQYGSILQTDWTVGSRIEFVTEWEGKIFKQWGSIIDVKPKQFVKYNLFAPRPGLEDKPENYFTMSYILTTENGQTNLEILQEDTRPNAVQEEPQGEENPVLQSLKRVVEAN
jgi:uncharacterized protein YndB with AHSA1/START domain